MELAASSLSSTREEQSYDTKRHRPARPGSGGGPYTGLLHWQLCAAPPPDESSYGRRHTGLAALTAALLPGPNSPADSGSQIRADDFLPPSYRRHRTPSADAAPLCFLAGGRFQASRRAGFGWPCWRAGRRIFRERPAPCVAGGRSCPASGALPGYIGQALCQGAVDRACLGPFSVPPPSSGCLSLPGAGASGPSCCSHSLPGAAAFLMLSQWAIGSSVGPPALRPSCPPSGQVWDCVPAGAHHSLPPSLQAPAPCLPALF